MTNLCAKTTQSSFNSVSISLSKTSQPVAIVQVGIFYVYMFVMHVGA